MLEKIEYLPIFEQEVATALELDSELALARQVNGLRLLHTPKEFGGDPEMAIQELLYTVEQGVHDHEVYYALGLAYLATHDEVNAAQFFSKALELEPDHEHSKQQLNLLQKGASS
ncbi:Tetratricopeptide repeat protein [compost metagenome]